MAKPRSGLLPFFIIIFIQTLELTQINYGYWMYKQKKISLHQIQSKIQ